MRYEVLIKLFLGERRNWWVVIGWAVEDGDWSILLIYRFGLHFWKIRKLVSELFQRGLCVTWTGLLHIVW